jgi:glutamate N-acetyltransferase/amino-acid N-acetyltransferase
MIKPDMATMLAFIATDAEINQTELQFSLKQAVDCSFNAITVDGDTSTNDACVLIATGASGVPVNQQHQEFTQALKEVFILLAQSIVRDGEGASKFVEIRVEQAGSSDDAKAMAYTIAHSPLVKTALFASDANWGRILAAVGRAPIEQLDINKVNLYLGDVCLIEAGNPHPDYNEQRGQQEMNKQDIEIRVNLNLGKHSATVWTTDLSYDYVKINAEYRS